ncbi:MAG: glycoside hydrolase family 25 protein [Tepidisphaerales bacterium]
MAFWRVETVVRDLAMVSSARSGVADRRARGGLSNAARVLRPLSVRGALTLGLVLGWGVLAVPQAQAQTRTRGIDVSSWQGVIDWARVARPISQGGGGIEFAFIRATRGGSSGPTSVVDSRFVFNITQARANGIRVGAYHFARFDRWTPGDWTGPNSPRDEAMHFLSVAGPYITEGSLRPVLDIENDSSDPDAASRFTKAELTAWALAFAEEITRALGPAARPIIYVNGWFANHELNPDINIYPLWLARYGSTGDPLTTGQPQPTSSLPNIYGVWNPTGNPSNHPWAFWQYTNTGSVPGISGNVDLNVFNNQVYGSIDAFTIATVIPEPASAAVALSGGVLLLLRRR